MGNSLSAAGEKMRPGVILFLSDLNVRLRGRTYLEPAGAHVALASGRDLDTALDHLERRADCWALGLLGDLPEKLPTKRRIKLLEGRRLLLMDSERAPVAALANVALEAGADVEWHLSTEIDHRVVGAFALPVAAVVLAAGAASRMGSNKLLLDLGGEPLVVHVVRAALEGGCFHALLVYSDPEVARVVAGRAEAVLNPEAESGQASSLRVGLNHLPPRSSGALLMLGDQPLVGARSVALLLDAWRREGSPPAVAATYGERDRWLPPVVVSSELFGDLVGLQGDAGARQLFAEQPTLLGTITVGGRPDDVDTPEDYERVIRLFPPREG